MNENKYLASVITPFHNTNLDYFKKAFQSVIDQTAGIENVEWVITVHNSEDEYLQGVRELAKDYESIKVLELHNEVRSASSPRNYALDHATGKYIFFLDSDDRLTPECIKEVTDKLELSGAPMAKFRSEEETEDDDVVEFVDHRARFDQTESMIVLHKGDHRIKDIMTIANMTPWCQAFRRDFLEEHHLRFDERLHFGEDGLFTITCMKYADPVIVLPQTIGYVYFINHDSTLQQMGAPTPESILQLAGNLSMQMSAGIDAGLDMRYIFWVYAHDIAGMIMGSPQMKEEQKEQVRDLIGKFFDQVEDLDADGKFYTEDVVQDWMWFARTVILGEQKQTISNLVSNNILMKLLADNRRTNVGEKYEFNLIHTTEAFRQKVPVVDYDFYAPLIKLMTRIGESNLFCSDKVKGYAVTTGTMGVPKRIPYTKNHLKQFQNAFVSICGNREGSTLLLASCLPQDHKFSHMDTISGAVLRSLREDLSDNSHTAKHKDGMITSPFELIYPKSSFSPVHLRLLFGLLDPDVTQIVSLFTWTVLELFEYLEKNYRILVEEIRNGRLDNYTEVPDGMKEVLESKIKADPARADALLKVFEEGFDAPVIRKIWPRMERIVAAGTGDFEIYTEKLEKYVGNDVILNNGYLAASEAVIARAVDNGSKEYALLVNNDFFEFIPDNTERRGTPVESKDLEPGRDYEIIVTNQAGLYRYRLGDIIHVERVENQTPVFTYLRRYHEVIGTEKTKITVNEVYEVVKRLEEYTGLVIHDFNMSWNYADNSVRILLEPAEMNQTVLDVFVTRRKELCGLADRELCRISEAYAAARENGEINETDVHAVEPQTHILFRDKTMYSWRCEPDQIKPVHVLDNPVKEKFFMQFVVK